MKCIKVLCLQKGKKDNSKALQYDLDLLGVTFDDSISIAKRGCFRYFVPWLALGHARSIADFFFILHKTFCQRGAKFKYFLNRVIAKKYLRRALMFRSRFGHYAIFSSFSDARASFIGHFRRRANEDGCHRIFRSLFSFEFASASPLIFWPP